jgi:hypothetical protein
MVFRPVMPYKRLIIEHAQSPRDWTIIQTHSAGELCFYNNKTGEDSWYTPPELTVDEIYEIPGADRYFRTKEDVAAYVAYMAAEKEKAEKSAT